MIGCKLSKTGKFKVGYGNAEIRQPLLFSMLNRQVVNKRAATLLLLNPPNFRPRGSGEEARFYRKVAPWYRMIFGKI